jgi:hypothetical protein
MIARTQTTIAHTCPGCGRPARECWVMPCLVLETALSKGQRAVASWWRRAGYTVAVKGKRIQVSE